MYSFFIKYSVFKCLQNIINFSLDSVFEENTQHFYRRKKIRDGLKYDKKKFLRKHLYDHREIFLCS